MKNIRVNHSRAVLLLSQLHFRVPASELDVECNGIIFDRENCNMLVLPLQRLTADNYSAEQIDELLEKYDYEVYPAHDGTVVNLYFSLGVWVISTTNGSHMNDVKWGRSTFRSLLTQCLARYNLTWLAFCELLTPTRCYSFVFRHPEMHFHKPSCEIRSLQDVDMDPASAEYCKPVHSQVGLIPQVAQIPAEFATSVSAMRMSVEPDASCYGFILRGGSEVPFACRNLLISSKLMIILRRVLYNVRVPPKLPWSRFDFCVAKVAVGPDEELAEFLRHFPKCCGYVQRYDDAVNQFARSVFRALKGTPPRQREAESITQAVHAVFAGLSEVFKDRLMAQPSKERLVALRVYFRTEAFIKPILRGINGLRADAAI